jgi:phospholipase C
MAPITRSPTGLTSYRAQRIGRELAAYDLPLFNAARFRHNAPRRSADEKPGRRRAHRVTYLPASPEGNHTRTVIASPYAKKRFVDHTVYDTTSILQFISKRFELQLLRGIRTQFGDLRNAFAFGR